MTDHHEKSIIRFGGGMLIASGILTICYYLLQYFAPILNTNPATETFWKLFPDQKYMLYANYVVVLVSSFLLLAYIPAIMSFNRVKSNWWGFVTWTTMIGLAGVFIGLYEVVRQLVLTRLKLIMAGIYANRRNDETNTTT